MMQIVDTIHFKKDAFTNHSLYNSALLFHPDDTISIRIGAINNHTETGQQIINRIIDAGYPVNEQKAHIMADYNFTTHQFSLYYYTNKPQPEYEVPLSIEEQTQAIHSIIQKFFMNKQAFNDFCNQALQTNQLAFENIKYQQVLTDINLSDIIMDKTNCNTKEPLELTGVTICLKDNTQIDLQWGSVFILGHVFTYSSLHLPENTQPIAYTDIDRIIYNFNRDVGEDKPQITIVGHEELDVKYVYEHEELSDIPLDNDMEL